MTTPPTADDNPTSLRGARRSAVLVAGAALALVVLALLWPLWRGLDAPAGPGVPGTASTPNATQGLPWQIDLTPAGDSRVFGLTLGQTRLSEAPAALHAELAWAVIANPGETGALEGFAENFTAGFLGGRLVLATDADPATVAGWRARLGKGEVFEGGSRRYGLQADATVAAEAAGLRIVGLSYLPSVSLDEAALVQRFGMPTERLVGAQGEVQLLYPQRGLAIALPDSGRPVLQYVAPREFDARLRAPLAASASASMGR